MNASRRGQAHAGLKRRPCARNPAAYVVNKIRRACHNGVDGSHGIRESAQNDCPSARGEEMPREGRGGILARLSAIAFATAMLFAPSGWLASAATPARDLSQTIVQVGETTAGDAGQGFRIGRRSRQFFGDDDGRQWPHRRRHRRPRLHRDEQVELDAASAWMRRVGRRPDSASPSASWRDFLPLGQDAIGLSPVVLCEERSEPGNPAPPSTRSLVRTVQINLWNPALSALTWGAFVPNALSLTGNVIQEVFLPL